MTLYYDRMSGSKDVGRLATVGNSSQTDNKQVRHRLNFLNNISHKRGGQLKKWVNYMGFSLLN